MMMITKSSLNDVECINECFRFVNIKSMQLPFEDLKNVGFLSYCINHDHELSMTKFFHP